MGIIKTKGIIIAENNMSDFDKMVTILTPSGKIGCAARGARKPKSMLMAATQFLCVGEYMLYRGTNSYSVNSCDTIEIFYNIRTDLDKLKYATHITKIINDVTDENQNTYKILQLFLNTLYMISETDKDLDFINSVFKIRLSCLLGFMPIINKCTSCGEIGAESYFSFEDSGFKCEACARQDKGAIKISKSTANAIKYIILADAKKIFSFNIAEENKRELEIIAKLYLNDKLDKEYKIEDLF